MAYEWSFCSMKVDPVFKKFSSPSIRSRTPPWLPAASMLIARSGFFTGAPYSRAIEVSQHLPPQIMLFLGNIYEYVRGDVAKFRTQVRHTLLHEIDHYLGLDEDEVGWRGL